MTVYLIKHPGDNAVKIGFTDGDPLDRLRSMQTGSASLLKLVATIPDAPLRVEKDLHRQFGHLRIRHNGEWFQDHPSIAQTFADHRATKHKTHLLATVERVAGLLATATADAANPSTGELEKILRESRILLAAPPCDCTSLISEDLVGVVEEDLLDVFWSKFRDQFVWDLLPFRFLHDLHNAWAARIDPEAKPLSRQRFIAEMTRIVRNDEDWYKPNVDAVRPAGRMDCPEPLIAKYDLQDWMDPSEQKNTSPDLDRLCRPRLKANYYGLRSNLSRSERASGRLVAAAAN